MEAEVPTTHTLCESSSHHKSNKRSFWMKSCLLNDDQEMPNSNVREGPNEAADMHLHQNIDNFQIVPEGKRSSLHSPCLKDTKFRNNKNCLEEKQLMYNGLAGDLISTRLHQHILYKKSYNSNEYLSQPIQSSFNETSFGDKSDVKPSPILKFHRKNMFFEDEKNSLVFPVTNSHGLKKETLVEKAAQFEDSDGNSYDVVRDEPGIQERIVPEFYMNITTNKANSLPQKNNTGSTQEVPKMYSYSPEYNEKWKNTQRFIKEQQLIYNGSAGDLISSIHWSNTNIPKGKKNNIPKSLSQPRAPPNEHLISVCTSERIMLPKTSKAIDGKVKIVVNHEISKSTDSEIQSEMAKVISTISKNENSFNSVSSECSSGRNWKWKDVEKHIKEEHCTYSDCAGEPISSTSGMYFHTPHMRQTTLKSLSQPAEYVGNKLIKEAKSEEKSNLKVYRDLPLSLQSSPCNTITEDEIMSSNTTIAEEIQNTASLKSPQNTILKDAHRNNTIQSCDVLNISRKCPLTGINSCKVLQEQLDQTVPNKEKTVDYETDEYACIAHNTDLPQDASNNPECKGLSVDVFADKDDISLYVHTVNDTPIYKLSQNVPKPLKAKENDEINDFNSRVEKKTDFVSFEDESLIEDTDCLYASDMFPICLTQPAVPTYLLRNSKSELSDNNPKVLETGTKTWERSPGQCFQAKTEKKIDSTDIESSENENTCADSCKSTMSTIISCTTPTSNTSLCQQNSVVLTSDINNLEASQQKIDFSVNSNCDATFEENLNFQIIPQNDKMDLNDQVCKTNICETKLKEANTKNRQSCNKNIYSNANEIQNLKDRMSPASNNKYQQTQGTIENLLVSKRDVLFIPKTFNKLDPCATSVALQNMSILKKQTHFEMTNTVDLICKPSNDTQSNQIIPVKSISKSETCINAAQQLHSNNTFLAQSTVVGENRCYSINNHPGLTQLSTSNGRYLDVAENLCHKYSLNSAKLLKSQATFKDTKEEGHQVMDRSKDSPFEEYDSDASISEVTSESNIDLLIDAAIEKYQNASSDSEKTSIQGTENMVNSMEVSAQTDICGLVQGKHCICKKFNLCCEFCNENSPKESETNERKRKAISSDSEMPLNKQAKCYSQKTQMMNCSDTDETENKVQVTQNITYTEDIKTLSQVYFNKSITPPQSIHDYCQVDAQGKYQHTKIFSWNNAKKSESPQKSPEVTVVSPKRAKTKIRIGLSKRAKTKRLHWSSN